MAKSRLPDEVQPEAPPFSRRCAGDGTGHLARVTRSQVAPSVEVRLYSLSQLVELVVASELRRQRHLRLNATEIGSYSRASAHRAEAEPPFRSTGHGRSQASMVFHQAEIPYQRAVFGLGSARERDRQEEDRWQAITATCAMWT